MKVLPTDSHNFIIKEAVSGWELDDDHRLVSGSRKPKGSWFDATVVAIIAGIIIGVFTNTCHVLSVEFQRQFAPLHVGGLHSESTHLWNHSTRNYRWTVVGTEYRRMCGKSQTFDASRNERSRRSRPEARTVAICVYMINKQVGLIIWGARTLWACAHSTKMASYNEPSNGRCW